MQQGENLHLSRRWQIENHVVLKTRHRPRPHSGQRKAPQPADAGWRASKSNASFVAVKRSAAPGFSRNPLPDLPEVIPNGGFDAQFHPSRTLARNASQSAGVGSRPTACTRSRKSLPVSGSCSKSGVGSVHHKATAPLVCRSVRSRLPRLRRLWRSTRSARALNVATSTVLILEKATRRWLRRKALSSTRHAWKVHCLTTPKEIDILEILNFRSDRNPSLLVLPPEN